MGSHAILKYCARQQKWWQKYDVPTTSATSYDKTNSSRRRLQHFHTIEKMILCSRHTHPSSVIGWVVVVFGVVVVIAVQPTSLRYHLTNTWQKYSAWMRNRTAQERRRTMSAKQPTCDQRIQFINFLLFIFFPEIGILRQNYIRLCDAANATDFQDILSMERSTSSRFPFSKCLNRWFSIWVLLQLHSRSHGAELYAVSLVVAPRRF